MSESRTNPTIQGPERARHLRWLAAAAAAALLVVTPVVAQSGAFGPASGPAFGSAGFQAGGPGYGRGMHGGAVGGMYGGMHPGMRGGAFGPAFGGTFGGTRGGALAPAALQRLPLGTDVTVQVYDADPAEGGEPVATLTATVGETSEVAFADEVHAAAADAAFATVLTGPRTTRVVLDVDTDLRRAPMAGLMRFGALEQGQTVEVSFFAGQDEAAPSTTLTFTYGEDSAAAFQQAVIDAAADAAVAEVTLPARERTVDLSVTPWFGARDSAGIAGYGMGGYGMGGYGTAEYGTEGGYGPGMGRPMQPGGGFGPRGLPSDPSSD